MGQVSRRNERLVSSDAAIRIIGLRLPIAFVLFQAVSIKKDSSTGLARGEKTVQIWIEKAVNSHRGSNAPHLVQIGEKTMNTAPFTSTARFSTGISTHMWKYQIDIFIH
jgi:hypothetical protein